jgi:hypothetical protein
VRGFFDLPALVLVLVAAMSAYRPRGLARFHIGQLRVYPVVESYCTAALNQAVLASSFIELHALVRVKGAQAIENEHGRQNPVYPALHAATLDG